MSSASTKNARKATTKNASTITDNTSTDRVCPLTLESIALGSEELMFKVCNDPNVYDVKALGEYVFFKSKGGPKFPHNRIPIPKETLQRLFRQYYAAIEDENPALARKLDSMKDKYFTTPHRNVADETNPIPAMRSITSYTDTRWNQIPIEYINAMKNAINIVYDHNSQIYWNGETYDNEINHPDTVVEESIKGIGCFFMDGISSPYIALEVTISNSTLDTSERYTLVFDSSSGEQHPIITIHHGGIYNAFSDYDEINIDEDDQNIYLDIEEPKSKEDLLSLLALQTTRIGGNQKHSYKGRKYKVHTGKRGGKYILVKSNKIYV